MSKRYSKEEVVELMYEYRRYAWSNGCSKTDCYRWLKTRGFVGEPTNKRKQYSVQDEIERKERIVENSNAVAYKLYCKELLDSPSTAEERIDRLNSIEASGKVAMDGINKEWVDGRDSLDKVMEAIERAEDRERMNSKHILTLQQAVNTLLDDKIEGTWWSRLWNNNN